MARILDLLMVAGPAILSVKLWTSGLYRRYRAFFLYLIFSAVHGGVLAIPRPDSRTYYRLWVLSEPVEWLFYVLVVLELYSLVLEDYRGLATVGRWSLIAAVAVALLASAGSIMAPSNSTTQGLVLQYYYLAERAVYLSLVAFVLTILGVLLQYPISLRRNIILHSIVFTIYFLVNTVVYLLLSLSGASAAETVRIPLQTGTILAIGTWVVMLNQAGEVRKQSLRPSWMPGREEELVSQLNHLNAALLRVTQK